MTTDYCTFWIGEELYGLPVQEVQEVLRDQRTTKVPLAPSEVRGLLNLRGQVVTTIDMRARLGLPSDESCQVFVVVRYQDRVMSLLVDEIGDVMAAHGDAREEVPDTLPLSVRRYLSSVVKLDRRLLLTLDVEAITQFEQ